MRIFTRELLALLGDLVLTTSKDPDLPGLCAIELHTARGAIGDDPGIGDLLCGSSTDRFVAAHTYTSCDGQLDAGKPILLPVAGAKAITDVFKGAAKNALHAVDIHHDDPGTLRISEDPNLVDDGLQLRVQLGDPEDYPIGVYRILGRELRDRVARPGTTEKTDPTPRTLAAVARLDPFLKVAKRHTELLRIYRTHQDEILQVQIGDSYRGVIMPAHADDSDPWDTHTPDAEIFAPELPEQPAATTDNAALGVAEPAPAHTTDAPDPDQTDLLADTDADAADAADVVDDTPED